MSSIPPALAFADHRRRYVHYSPRYHGRQRLDIWAGPHQTPGAPVMVFAPGGAWASGSRWTMQGHALMAGMVKRGWVCLSIDYRTAPAHRWPAPFEDMAMAVQWARTHAQDFGGDPGFVAAAGASAGGHLVTLAALTPGLVDAAVSIYGSYDWTDRSTLWRAVFMEYLERVVVGKRFAETPGVFRASSPMDLVHGAAAPMLLVHGGRDALISVAEARRFHRELSAVASAQYLEIPGAVHGFDMLNAGHAKRANTAIADFLGMQYDRAKSAERLDI